MSVRNQRIVFLAVVVAIALPYWIVTHATAGGAGASGASFAGSGDQTTEQVPLAGDYLVAWSARDGGGTAIGCYHAVHLEGAQSESLVSTMVPGGQTQTGTTNLNGLPSGSYYVKVISGCAGWTVRLTPR